MLEVFVETIWCSYIIVMETMILDKTPLEEKYAIFHLLDMVDCKQE
jgi:hypothetical protein